MAANCQFLIANPPFFSLMIIFVMAMVIAVLAMIIVQSLVVAAVADGDNVARSVQPDTADIAIVAAIIRASSLDMRYRVWLGSEAK